MALQRTPQPGRRTSTLIFNKRTRSSHWRSKRLDPLTSKAWNFIRDEVELDLSMFPWRSAAFSIRKTVAQFALILWLKVQLLRREKNVPIHKRCCTELRENCPLLGTRRGVEREPVTAVCNARSYQTQPSDFILVPANLHHGAAVQCYHVRWHICVNSWARDRVLMTLEGHRTPLSFFAFRLRSIFVSFDFLCTHCILMNK